MAGRLIGAWNPALDSNAAPLSGAQLSTYVAGTTTPKATYTDSSLGTPLANPVVADSAGRFVEIWAPDGGTYDLVWKTAGGVIIKTFSGLQALGSAATGAVARDFGADGRFNLESRGGIFEIEGGAPTPDNVGGNIRIGGWNGTQADLVTIDAASVVVTGALSGSSQRGAIGGLLLSTTGSSATFSVGLGQATDSTGSHSMVLRGVISKTTSAWASGFGAGGLDTGSIANNTWYHVYLLQRPDTGVLDAVFSTNATTPILPASYTLYRRIGAVKTNGSAQWIKFTQVGDEFLWDAAASDYTSQGIGTSPVTLTLSTPPGVSTTALFNWSYLDTTGANQYVLFSSPNQAVAAAASTYASGGPFNSSSIGGALNGSARIRTDILSQVRVVSTTGAGAAIFIKTQGYIDRRGQDD